MLQDPNYFSIVYAGYFFSPFGGEVKHIDHPVYILTDDSTSCLGTFVIELSLENITIAPNTSLIAYTKLYGLEILAFKRRYHVPIITLTINKIPETIFYSAIYPFDPELDSAIHTCTGLSLPIDIHLEFYNSDSSCVTFTLNNAIYSQDIFNILTQNQNYVSAGEFPSLLEALGYDNIAQTIVKLYME